jgi:hypothetical protein
MESLEEKKIRSERFTGEEKKRGGVGFIDRIGRGEE